MDFKTKKSPLPGLFDTRACINKLASACKTHGAVVKLEPLSNDEHAVALFGHKGPQIWLDWIESTIKGAGAQALLKLTRAADAENAVLRCYVDGDINGGLFAFYERFGFVRDPAGSPIMERPPVASLGVFENKNFGRWFQGSQVVDALGKPLIVYHGTQAQFKIIDLMKVKDIGFHLGTEEQARFFATGKNANLMSFYATIKNPLNLKDTFDCKVTSAHDTIWQLEQIGVVSKTASASLRELAIKNFHDKDAGLWRTWGAIRNAIECAGYDGIRYENGSESEGEGTSWVVFRSNQLKSTSSNCGQFDPNDPDFTR